MKDTARYYKMVKLFLPKAGSIQRQQTYIFTHSQSGLGGEWSKSRAGRFILGKELQSPVNKKFGGPIVSVWMLRNLLLLLLY